MDMNPDKGWGKPGSLRWHNMHIMACETIDELEDYFFKATGEKICRRGNLYNLQRNAQKRIKRMITGKKVDLRYD